MTEIHNFLRKKGRKRGKGLQAKASPAVAAEAPLTPLEMCYYLGIVQTQMVSESQIWRVNGVIRSVKI